MPPHAQSQHYVLLQLLCSHIAQFCISTKHPEVSINVAKYCALQIRLVQTQGHNKMSLVYADVLEWLQLEFLLQAHFSLKCVAVNAYSQSFW